MKEDMKTGPSVLGSARQSHTSGPWIFEGDKVAPNPDSRSPDSLLAICLMYEFHPLERPQWRTEANARLIASAPDLLKALKHLVHWHDQLSKEDIAIAEAVIAKADGRA